MRVLLLVHRLTFGGTQRQVVELARGLRGRGHDVRVAQFYGGGPLEAELRQAGIDVSDFGKRGRWDLLGFGWRAVRAVRSFRPEVVYSLLVAPNLLALALRPLVGRPALVWGVRASNMDFERYDALSRISFRAGCVLAHLADRIVVNSVAGFGHHRDQGYPADRMAVVPNGIDTERFRPDPEAGRAFRAELGLAPQRKVIGLVARLDPMKDHATFLDAAARLAGRWPDVSWLAVGDGPPAYAAALADRASRLGLDGRLVWAGARRDVEAAYNAMDVATSTSAFGEGFPNAVAEALACGRPAVVTDVGDSARVVAAPGRVVQPRDPAALAAAWEACLVNPAGHDGVADRERIVREFSLERLAERTELELAGAMSGPAVP